MFNLILSIIISSVVSSADMPRVDGSFFVNWPVSYSQEAGDRIVDGRLPLADNKISAPYKTNQNSLGVEVTAEAGIVVDWDSGKVLWQKDSGQQRSIASITKLMTALVFLDSNPGWDHQVTIESTDQRVGGAALLVTGSEVSVRDLFYLSLVRSVNSAAVALARSTGLSTDQFVVKMNEKANSLGMNNTKFIETTGLHSGNVSTAEDLVIMLRAALSSNAIANATILSQYKIPNSDQIAYSTDRLLGSFLNKAPYKILGGKTGYIDEAGYCLTVGIQRGEQRVASVMLGSSTIDNRFNDTKGIVDWVFRNYNWFK